MVYICVIHTLTSLLKLPDKESCKGLFLSIVYIQEGLERLALVWTSLVQMPRAR